MRIPTIGIEIHVELKTATKMFCACPNDPEERRPNINVCPICLAHPGAMPVANRSAIEAVLRVGFALGGEATLDSHFDRKSYFYPDLPKGFQISQYEAPLIVGGMLKNVRIRRIHLEEDTGRLLHELPGGKQKKADSLSYVDYNRAGVPLMELVTEPDVKSAEEAVAFGKELQMILRYLGVSDADMERGQMRVEANISLDMGTKVEVKNINSFRAVFGAIEYEIKRQNAALDVGEKIIQETRGWDDVNEKTVSQRSKESAHDYRYFPEPDLPPLDLRTFDLEHLKSSLPELPDAKRRRFGEEFGLNKEQTDRLIEDRHIASYFEDAVSELKTRNPAADFSVLHNYFTTDLWALLNETSLPFAELKITPAHLAHLVALIADGKLSSRLAKDLLRKMFETGTDPEELMGDSGLRLMEDVGELEKIVNEIISKNPKPVADYRSGNKNSVQFLIGRAMAMTKGQASPGALKELFEKALAS